MGRQTPRMDAEQFSAVAATCQWSDRSLAVVREILVDGASVADAAARHDISSKHARVLVTRLVAKAEQQRLAAFMEREQPKLVASPLSPHSNEIRTLQDKGYSIEQIGAYLKSIGVDTPSSTLREFLRSYRA